LILTCFFSVHVFLYVGTCICMWACWRQIIWQTGEKQEKDAFRVREDEPNSGSVVSTDWQLQFTCQHQKRFRFVSFRSTELHWNTMLNLTIHCISHSLALGTFPFPNPTPSMGKLQLCVFGTTQQLLNPQPSTLNPSVVFLMRQLWQSIAKSAESKEQRISCLHLLRWDATNKILIKAQHSFTLEDFYSQTPNLLFLPPLSCCVCN